MKQYLIFVNIVIFTMAGAFAQNSTEVKIYEANDLINQIKSTADTCKESIGTLPAIPEDLNKALSQSQSEWVEGAKSICKTMENVKPTKDHINLSCDINSGIISMDIYRDIENQIINANFEMNPFCYQEILNVLTVKWGQPKPPPEIKDAYKWQISKAIHPKEIGNDEAGKPLPTLYPSAMLFVSTLGKLILQFDSIE